MWSLRMWITSFRMHTSSLLQAIKSVEYPSPICLLCSGVIWWNCTAVIYASFGSVSQCGPLSHGFPTIVDVNSVGVGAGGWCRFFFSFSTKIIPADKGRTSVVLDTDTNQTKMTFLIENRPYQHLNKVPRNRQTRKLPEGLLTLNRSRHVSKTVYYKIRPRHKQPPRIYGLPKLHKTFKTDCVIREQLRLWFVGVSR